MKLPKKKKKKKKEREIVKVLFLLKYLQCSVDIHNKLKISLILKAFFSKQYNKSKMLLKNCKILRNFFNKIGLPIISNILSQVKADLASVIKYFM